MEVPAPMKQLERLSTTGHPFWIKANECARPVEIHFIRECEELQAALRENCPGFVPAINLCFENAFFMASRLESLGSKYVEGFTISPDSVNSHAWLSFQGRYYDPTLEHGFSLPGYKLDQDWRQRNDYIALIEESPSTLRNQIGFEGFSPFCDESCSLEPPFSKYLWNVKERYEQQFLISNGIFEWMMGQFANPDSQPL